MKRFALFLIALVPCLISSTCDAQLEKENQLGLSYMLSFGGVEQELEMTEEQVEELIGYSMNVQAEVRQEFEAFASEFSPRLPAEEQDALKFELEDGIKKIRENELARLKEVLLPNQIKRLKEIRVQFFKRHHRDGLAAIADELGLSSKQVSRINKVRDEFQQKITQMRMLNSGQQREREDKEKAPERTDFTPREMAEKLAEAKAEAKQELMAVLTSKQRQKLKQIEGDEYEFQTAKTKRKIE